MIIRDVVNVNIVRNMHEHPIKYQHLINPSWKQICDAQRNKNVDTIITISGMVGSVIDFKKIKSRKLCVYYARSNSVSEHIELYDAVVSVRKMVYDKLVSSLKSKQ